MTSHHSPSHPTGKQHQRHRLVPRARLAADYEARYGSAAVAAYGLAVRDVVEGCPEIGPVDTWSRLAELICRERPGRHRNTLRKKLSRHFTAETKGPPWPTVVQVVEFTVAPGERPALLDHLGRLYEEARKEKPPSEGREPAGPHVDPGADAGRTARREQQEIASLKQQLADSRAENARLRAARHAAGRLAGPGRAPHRPPAAVPRPQDVPRQRDPSTPATASHGGRNPGRFTANPPTPRLDQTWFTPATNWIPGCRHDPLPRAQGGLLQGRPGGGVGVPTHTS
ncbi:hypothetical protein KBX06_13335 [Micromonospora sp. C31]|uniref:hypothetical protein n=1 Tax=Micromonospora sp. C31 TaxID=2824876 RepID=UPI001B372FBB|nr:hypothetical protein [Micromonospora sp. C31]MBQ1074136.1 hypothetical protein [Micromonospora sp. C31]